LSQSATLSTLRTAGMRLPLSFLESRRSHLPSQIVRHGSNQMNEPISIHERRRRAPLAYWAEADNARFAAYLLSREMPAGYLPEAAAHVSYYGTPSIAIGEAFMREAALAIELIVKATIAGKIERGEAPKHVVRVRPVHDVPTLWTDAGLPALSQDDRRRLLLVKSLLTWSGRYAAPKKDEDVYKEREEDEAIMTGGKPRSGLRLVRHVAFDWDNFDRLYQIVLQEFGRGA
jgi:hypothetical protein